MAAVDPFESRGKPALVEDNEVEVESDFDLDAVIAERTPVKAFTFKFGGEWYTLPAHPDMVAASALAAGRLDEGFERLFGAAQWERLHQSEAILDEPALVALIERYKNHTGVDLGESTASPRSSRPTAKR